MLAADLAAAPIRELLHSKLTIELSVTPGRDYSDMVTPAVMEPFTPELWDWLPDLLHCARHCGVAEMKAHLLALEEAGLAQGKKRKPITAAQLKKLWKVKDNKDSTCTIAGLSATALA